MSISPEKHHNHYHPKEFEKLGVEVVELLRSNTKLNYDVCAFNLIEIFQLLGSKLPNFSPSSNELVESIRVLIILNNISPICILTLIS